jgi:hypothetical protein
MRKRKVPRFLLLQFLNQLKFQPQDQLQFQLQDQLQIQFSDQSETQLVRAQSSPPIRQKSPSDCDAFEKIQSIQMHLHRPEYP